MWTDLGGNPEDRWACTDIPCTRCGAAVGARCINPETGKPSPLPCLDRTHRFAALAEPVGDESPVGDHLDGGAA